jgi:hypothetical protein
MPPLPSVGACYGVSFGCVDLFCFVPLYMFHSRLPASFAATFGAAVGLQYRCPCIPGRILEQSVVMVGSQRRCINASIKGVDN